MFLDIYMFAYIKHDTNFGQLLYKSPYLKDKYKIYLIK